MSSRIIKEYHYGAIVWQQHPFEFPRGDASIRVKYNGQLIIGKVCSHAMALVSTRWKNFFFDPRAMHVNTPRGKKRNLDDSVILSSDQSAPEPADFTEDDGDAILSLLRIVHLHFDDIPASLSYNTLLQLAVLCDQYDCLKLTKPWMSQWLDTITLEKWVSGKENALYIFWVFGKAMSFETLAKRLTLHTMSKEGNLFTSSRLKKLMGPMPPGIVGSIAEVRLQVIADLLAIPYNLLDRYENADGRVCTQGIEQTECDAMSYGSLVLAPKAVNLWPRKSPKDIKGCVNYIAADIQLLHIIELQSTNDHHLIIPHSGCIDPCGSDYFFRTSVLKVLKNIPSPVLEPHRIHMKGRKD